MPCPGALIKGSQGRKGGKREERKEGKEIKEIFFEESLNFKKTLRNPLVLKRAQF